MARHALSVPFPARALALAVALALGLSAVTLAPPRAARAQDGGGILDGDPATTERIDAGDPVTAAVEVSRRRFPGTAPHAVLATTATFADSLAGAALTTDGPLLLTDPGALPAATAAELDRVLAPGATAYVLGGVDAVSPAVEAALRDRGLSPVRLAGETRVETALAVADEVRRLTPGEGLLLARSDGPTANPTAAWADSVPGGALAAATGIPILVTPTDALHPAVAAWIAADAPERTTLLGGEAALAPAVAAAVPGAARLAGPERTATAAEIAAAWPTTATADGPPRFTVLDGGRADGWAYGLSAAGAAADAGAPPLLVVGTAVSAETRRLVSACGAPAVDLLLAGSTAVIGEDIADALDALDGGACADPRIALRTLGSCDAALAHFVEEGLARVGPYGLDGYWYGAQPAPEPLPVDQPVEEAPSDGGSTPPPPPPAPPPPPGEPAAPTDDAGGEGLGGGDGDAPTDVSGTNTQEVGVDEPDRVKTDGRALYAIDGSQLQVVDLRGRTPVHATTVEVPGAGYGSELLLHDGVLVVVSRGNTYTYPVDGGAPPPDQPTTDPATDPATGGFAQEPADEPAFFAPEPYYPEPSTIVTRYDITDPVAPRLLDQAEVAGDSRSARMVDGIVRLVVLANPTGLDFVFPRDDSQAAQDEALAHNRGEIESSTIDDWLPTVSVDGGEPRLAVDCGAVHVPPDFAGISTAMVAAIDVAASADPTSAAAVVANADTIYASTQRMVLTSARWGIWSPDAPPASVTTEVHSFDISDPLATAYVGSGQVDGYVLNSFAISEHRGYLRIATTTEPPWDPETGGGETDNGLTVLAEGGTELFHVGRVTGLGAGERIFAVRYLGDLAAVVTFRQVDPLYLIDLTDPAAPRVTGELKIPGVSHYLHPLGSDVLLGVGQDGDEDGRLTGVQVSLFDIRDRAAPTRVDTVDLGPGFSPVEADHKAFLHWAPAGRAFVPAYLDDGRTGVQVIDVDPVGLTLDLAGRIGPPAGFDPYADRTAIVGPTAYTIGYGGVSGHDLATLADLGYAPFPGYGDGSVGGGTDGGVSPGVEVDPATGG